MKLLTGPRGAEASYRILVAEISPDDPEALSEAEREIDRLPAIDRRRVLATFASLIPAPRPIEPKLTKSEVTT